MLLLSAPRPSSAVGQLRWSLSTPVWSAPQPLQPLQRRHTRNPDTSDARVKEASSRHLRTSERWPNVLGRLADLHLRRAAPTLAAIWRGRHHFRAAACDATCRLPRATTGLSPGALASCLVNWCARRASCAAFSPSEDPRLRCCFAKQRESTRVISHGGSRRTVARAARLGRAPCTPRWPPVGHYV